MRTVSGRRAVRRPLAVLLPGSGSDEVFVASAFEEPLADAGIDLLAPRPSPGPGVVAAFDAALSEAAGRHGPVLVGGVSLGAHVAASWAVRHPSLCRGLVLVMPAWLGAPGDAPAAVAARATADALDADGLDATLAQVRAGSPPWLADELDRAWHGYGAGLADSLRAAARTAAPTPEQLRGLDVPAGVVACADDPLHPLATAQSWADALPRAALAVRTLTEVGADRRTLGHAALVTWVS